MSESQNDSELLAKGGISRKHCIECATEIPIGAKKCAVCGSYQDWRRHVPFGQSTLALALSLIAIITAFVGGGQQIAKHISSLLGVRGGAILGAKIEISDSEAVFSVLNQSPESVVINSILCSLYLPIDADARLREAITEQPSGTKLNPDRPYLARETVGMFLVSYRIAHPLELPSGSEALLDGTLGDVTPPLQPTPPPKGDQPVGSYCTVGGVGRHNEIEMGAIALKPADLFDFDLLKMLSLASYPPSDEKKRQEVTSRVIAARKPANAANSGH